MQNNKIITRTSTTKLVYCARVPMPSGVSALLWSVCPPVQCQAGLSPRLTDPHYGLRSRQPPQLSLTSCSLATSGPVVCRRPRHPQTVRRWWPQVYRRRRTVEDGCTGRVQPLLSPANYRPGPEGSVNTVRCVSEHGAREQGVRVRGEVDGEGAGWWGSELGQGRARGPGQAESCSGGEGGAGSPRDTQHYTTTAGICRARQLDTSQLAVQGVGGGRWAVCGGPPGAHN